MADRSKFDVALEGLLSKIPGLADKLPELTGKISDQVKTIARHPRSVGTLIESRSSWLNRKFLGVASNIVEPFLVGMGLSVTGLSEDSVDVSMPGFIRNQGEVGVVHNAALAALGEFAARIFWEHHLDLQRSELLATSISTRIMARASGPLRAIFRFPVSEREAVLLALRSKTHAEADSVVSIYDAAGKLVAEVEIKWRFAKRLSISAGSHERPQARTEKGTDTDDES